MHSIASIEIDRPIDEVFTYTNEKVDEWSLTVAVSYTHLTLPTKVRG